MNVVPNHTKRCLAAGGVALGMGVRQSRTVDVATVARSSDFDWLFIDMEHSSMNLDTAAQIAMAALAVGITPLVRVPGPEHHHASRILDTGAQGVVLPHVDTPDEAARVVSHCKYPPVGRRSIGGPQPQLGFRPVPVDETLRLVNDETLVVVMLETPAAIANSEAIAAVTGVDVLLIGTNDLCAELGIPGKFTDAKVENAYRTVIAACHKHGKYPGMGGVYDPPIMERYIRLGMRFILSGSDLAFMMAGARARAGALRSIKL